MYTFIIITDFQFSNNHVGFVGISILAIDILLCLELSTLSPLITHCRQRRDLVKIVMELKSNLNSGQFWSRVRRPAHFVINLKYLKEEDGEMKIDNC